MTHVGSRFCGAAEMEVNGAPEVMGCRHCRSWSGGPVNAFSLWRPKAVRVSSDGEHIASGETTAA